MPRTHWSSSVPSPAVLRAGAVLDAVAGARGERVTVGELAAELGIARSSAANVCEALGRLGLLNEREGGFTLGPRIVELSRAYLEALVPARSFAEATRGLAETVQLATLDGLDVVYLGRHDGSEPVGLLSGVGRRLPATTTALGKAMLSALDPADVAERLAAAEPLPALTSRSHGTAAAVLADLDRTRSRGHAVDDEETSDGVYCVAVAVSGLPPDAGQYAVSSSLIKAQVDEPRLRRVLAVLERLAAEVGRP